MAGLASSHDPVHAPALLPAAGQAGTKKKQPGLTLYQVAEALEAVLALFRHLLRDGRTILAEVLARLQGRAARNAAAARSHARRRLVEQPP